MKTFSFSRRCWIFFEPASIYSIHSSKKKGHENVEPSFNQRNYKAMQSLGPRAQEYFYNFCDILFRYDSEQIDESYEILQERLEKLKTYHDPELLRDYLLGFNRSCYTYINSLYGSVSYSTCAKIEKKLFSLKTVPELLEFSSEILTAYRRHTNASKDQLSEISPIIADAVQYIKKHLGDPLSLTFMADRYGYNEPYFSSLFHNVMGIGLTQFIQKERVQLARRYLISTNLPIEKIAKTVGFNSSGYFSTVFKKHYGITPSEFRRHAELLSMENGEALSDMH